MSDPIEKLTRLGDAMEGAPMPLPASEVRARGDRIRRRRNALVAGAGAAVVAAVAVPVVALTAGGSDRDPDVAPSPTVSDPVPGPSPALGEENLLTGEDAIYPNGGADWEEHRTFEGDGQATASPCQQTSFGGLGADSVFQRQFQFVVTESGEVEPTLDLNEVVAEFASGADARSAYDEVKAWLGDCLPFPAEYYEAGEFAPVALGAHGSAERQLSTYGPVEEELDPFGDEVYFLDTGVVLSGDRIAVLTQLTHGQDYTWPDGSPVEQMLPVAAERLARGNEEAAPEETAPTTDGPATTVPAGFPLDLAVTGEPPTPDPDTQVRGPAPGTTGVQPQTICGEDLAPTGSGPSGDGEEVLGYSVSTVEGYDGRMLRAFPTAQAAVDAVASLRARVQGCDRDSEGDGLSDRLWRQFADDSGYDSLTFGYTYEVRDGVGASAGQLYTVLRVGNAVLAIEWGGEYGAETQAASAPDQVELASAIAGEMCIFTVAGC